MIGRSLAAILAAALALSSAAPAPAQSKSKAETSSQTKAPALKPFDLNSASEEDLVLTGIDRATVKKIIAARPFRSKQELVSRKLLTKEQYEKIKDLLVAKQPPKTPAR
ncbi:MAG TPA: helix-hairpin-helix domain-containing protein [Terriglobia bacterium]|nr:helix-hairpin-helix domain-containing protein [Terriglobia bacterium]